MSTEPTPATADPRELFADYLRFYREKAIEKVATLSPEEQRSSRLPSGWTPLELLHHLAHMERRWFVWGFLGEDVEDPWGDGADRWQVPEDIDLAAISRMLREVGEAVDRVLAGHDLAQLAPPGPRFGDGPPASLAWI